MTPAEAERLNKLAARDTGPLGINILMAIGVTAIASSILAFKLSATTAIILGFALIAVGLAIYRYRGAKWGFLGFANILVGAVAWGVFHLSKKLTSLYERLAGIAVFSSISGSGSAHCGGTIPGHRGKAVLRSSAMPAIPDYAFGVLCAVALVAVGTWGVKRNRRFVVNVAAVVASIHFYTQWFEHLHATPLSIFIAGLITVGVAVGLWKYNSVVLDQPAATAE